MHINFNEQDSEGQEQERAPRGPEPLQVRVPFLNEATALGDAIARATGALGVQPCGGCKKRQEEMNRRVVFTPWG